MRIDKGEVERRFRRSMGSYDEHAVEQRRIAERLRTLVSESVTEAPRRILEIGCGTGTLTALLRERFPEAEFFVNDLVPELCAAAAERCGIAAERRLPGDAETLALPGGCDLVVSASTFQWFVRPEETLRRIASALRPEGTLAFSTFGEQNMREVREVAGAGLPYRGREEMTRLLEERFAVERIEEERRVLEFPEPADVLRHLKRTGVNASGSREAWTRGRLQAFADEFRRRFEVDGRVPLTYHPMYFVCRKRGV